MSETKAVLALVAGAVAIVLGLTIKQFYASRGSLGVTVSDRPISTWKGRLLFLAVGTLLVHIGLKFFLFEQ